MNLIRSELTIFSRYISPLSKQYILRLIKLGNWKFSLKNWTLDWEQNKVSQIELTDFRIMKALDQDNLKMNEHFARTLQKTFLNGYLYSNFQFLIIFEVSSKLSGSFCGKCKRSDLI